MGAFEMHWVAKSCSRQAEERAAAGGGKGEEGGVGGGQGAREREERGERGREEVKRKGGEEVWKVMPVTDMGLLAKQEALWGLSLAFLALTLGGVWIQELERLLIASEGNVTKELYPDSAVLQRLDIGLNRRLTNLAFSFKLSNGNNFVWLRHAWVDGDTFALTLFDPSFDTAIKRVRMRRCKICEERRPNSSIMFLSPCACTQDLCEPCLRRHWESGKELGTLSSPWADVRCPVTRSQRERLSLAEELHLVNMTPWLFPS